MKTACLTAALFLVILTMGKATTLLDQEQTEYDGGLSARTLPGYAVGQSFTAGITGNLSEIDMGFFNQMSGSGQLQIFAGGGITGQLLQTETVTVTGTDGGISWNDWNVNVPVVSGSQYTFIFTPNAATLPDPYGVAVGDLDTYTGGSQIEAYPGSVDSGQFQSVFRTYVTLPAQSGSSPAPILQYTFNETGTTAASTGSNPAPLQFLNASGSAADLHSADALGVSGLPGDRAFDNTASTGMGKGYTGGVGEIPAGTIGTLDSFTFQCWFNVATPIQNLARFIEDKYISLQAIDGNFIFYVNGVHVSSGVGYNQTNQWVFMAVTYDGTKTSDNVAFYVGTKTTPVVQVGASLSLDGSSVAQDYILAIGNYNNANIRPLDGLIDDVRLYGSASDSSGVLTQPQLEALRQQDNVNGEDTLENSHIDVSGNILQESGSGGKSTDTSLTIPNVLDLLGVSGGPPAGSLRYYFDVSKQSYVIAPKSDAAFGFGFPTATLLSLGNGGVGWNTGKSSSVAAFPVTGLNGNLSGTGRSHTARSGGFDTTTLQSTAFGTLSGLQSIMDCNVVEVFRDPK